MKITRRMEWPYKDKFGSLEEVSEYFQLLYQTLTEESALRAVELDVPYTDGYNVFLGHEAGQSNTISLDDTEGIYNVFIGHQAGYSNTTGIKNIAIGFRPLYTNTTGGENTALGSEALYSNTSGANNVALGNDALYTNATGNYNVAVGFEALKVSTASNNVALGYQAMVANTSGANNIALGYQTLDANSTGAGNVAIGESALTANTTANYNLAIGYNALASNTDGHTNVAIGYSALTSNTSADFNVAIGYNALLTNTVTTSSIAIGVGALEDFNRTPVVATENIAIGYYAMREATTGIHNVAIGGTALSGIVTGDMNVAIGRQALGLATGGANNTAVGAHAGNSLTSGAQNTIIGKDTGYTGLTTGDGNVFIGYQAAYNETGSNKLYIANSNTATPLIGGVFPNTSLTFTAATTTFSGNLVLPADGVVGVTDGNPQIIFDNTNNWLEITGKVGINTPSPLQDFEVRSTGFTYAIVSSDRDGGGGAQGIGMLGFYAKNDAAEDIRYVRVDGIIEDGVDASEDGSLNIFTMVAGSEALAVTIANTALTVVGCVSDGTCEIMKNEDALAIIDDILKTGSGEKDEHDHERMDMEKIHQKYPYMIHKQEDKYFDKLGAKSDLLYVAIGQLVTRIKALEAGA